MKIRYISERSRDEYTIVEDKVFVLGQVVSFLPKHLIEAVKLLEELAPSDISGYGSGDDNETIRIVGKNGTSSCPRDGPFQSIGLMLLSRHLTSGWNRLPEDSDESLEYDADNV